MNKSSIGTVWMRLSNIRQSKNLITPQLYFLRDILLCKRPRTDGSTKMSLAKTGNLNIGALKKCTIESLLQSAQATDKFIIETSTI